MPNSFQMPSDDDLLIARPESTNYERAEVPVTHSPLKAAAAYALAHPTATAYLLATGWGAGLADAIAPLDTYTKRIGVRLGSPAELLEHLDEHPGDWLDLIPGGKIKMYDMIENPEDYAE